VAHNAPSATDIAALLIGLLMNGSFDEPAAVTYWPVCGGLAGEYSHPCRLRRPRMGRLRFAAPPFTGHRVKSITRHNFPPSPIALTAVASHHPASVFLPKFGNFVRNFRVRELTQ
jgi:hypothetical protein